MKYKKFIIENYRAIKNPLEVDVTKNIIPLVGINECGKTTILQAIYCFDKVNDKTYGGNHLENTGNLYETVNKDDSLVSAIVEVEVAFIKTEIDKIRGICEAKIGGLEDETHVDEIEAIKTHLENLNIFSSNLRGKQIEMKIVRNLNTKEYSSDFFPTPIVEDMNLLNKIVNGLPYILYNDDFNDRPESRIVVGEYKNDWEEIYERVFRATNEDYSLAMLFEKEKNTQLSILEDVNAYISKTLTKAWKRFSNDKPDIKIAFEAGSEKIADDKGKNIVKNILEVKIKETKNGKTRAFDISDRSKGFIWYYNFIMKVQFNAKQVGDKGETIFLLDEPGSYLHETAQKELCEKLSEISKNEGTVIYCTHSPQLLNPSIVRIRDINIVSKKGISIEMQDLSNYKTKSKKISALQPIYEALQIPEYEMVSKETKIICVEGIYDKYAIEIFCDKIDENMRIFPSANTDAIVCNISYFIAYNIPYLAIWDNDKAGRCDMEKARKIFGEREAKNFNLLPIPNKVEKVRMEEMFTKEDLINIANYLKIDGSVGYNTLISTVYFECTKGEKVKIKKLLSDYSKHQFLKLDGIISKHFNEDM